MALTNGVLLWSGLILALTRTSRQPEVMWWVYPIVASFIATLWIIKFILAGAFGIRFPESSSNNRRKPPRRPGKGDIIRIATQNKDKIKKKKEEFGQRKAEVLKKYPNERDLEKHSESKELVENLSLRERVFDKIFNSSLSYEDLLSRIYEFLTEEEIDELLLILDELGLLD